MKISILTPDISHNCFGRAWLLAKILQRYYDIEVIGPDFGNGIWQPLKDQCDFNIISVKGSKNNHFDIKKLLKEISGDVIYASKPRLESFGPGILKKILSRKPLILDIDDWELGWGKRYYESLPSYKMIYDFLLSMTNVQYHYYKVLLHKLIWITDDITVSGKILKTRYNGTIIWHGRDVNSFNPQKINGEEVRNKYLSNRNKNEFIVGFIGTPRRHKGLEQLLNAIAILENRNISVLIIGFDDSDYCKYLKIKVKELAIIDRVIFFERQPFNKLPELLSLFDIVIIPQQLDPVANGQVPAKLFDAMAMAKPIIATNVYDIPDILKDCGWIVDPTSPKQLADTIEFVYKNPLAAKEKGKKARQMCEKEYSWEVIGKNMKKLFSKYE